MCGAGGCGCLENQGEKPTRPPPPTTPSALFVASPASPHAQHDAQLDYYSKRLATCSSDRKVKVFDVSGAEHVLLADLPG